VLAAQLLISHVVAGATATGPVTAAATTPIAPSAGCPGLDALNPLCQAGNVAGSVAGSGINAVLSGLSQWVASGAEWLLSQIGHVLVSTTTIDIGASWFHQHYAEMTVLAGVVVLPLLLVSTMQAVYRQNAGQLIRAFFVQLPLALLLGVVAIQIVVLCLSATDAMCTAVAGGSGSDVTALLAGVSNGMVAALGDPTMATFVLLLVGLLVAVAAFVLWLELLVRAAAVYVAVLFLPLALATLVWPSVSHWCRRLVETLAALILSKFVIVATLSLAASAVSSGTADTAGTAGSGAGSGGAGSGFAAVLAGGALLVLSTFVPFAILRLIPIVEAGAVGHLEGARQRGMAPVTAVPRTAASFALKEGTAAHRSARGAARLAAVTGPPGTGAMEAGGSGGGGAAGGDEEIRAMTNSDNGGCLPDSSGRMVGISTAADGGDPENLDLPPYVPHPVGPKPITPPSGRSAGSGGAGGAVGGLVPVGSPGFNGLQHAIGRDHIGPVLTYLRDDDDDRPPAARHRPGSAT
jgi:hypothetical protein